MNCVMRCGIFKDVSILGSYIVFIQRIQSLSILCYLSTEAVLPDGFWRAMRLLHCALNSVNWNLMLRNVLRTTALASVYALRFQIWL